jgi:hypothetical protein
MDFWLPSHPFLSRLYGGEHGLGLRDFFTGFLSRLYGGEQQHYNKKVSCNK